MFVAGFIGFFLDNTIPGNLINSICVLFCFRPSNKHPGTRKERGLEAWEAQFAKDTDASNGSCYDIPFVMGLIRKYVPGITNE